MNARFPNAVPEVPVSHISRALDYYSAQLGFTVDWGDDEGGIAGVSKGDCRLFLTNVAFREGRGNSSPIVIWINLDSNDEVDELHAQWSSSGAKIVAPPESKPWGLREFTVADLEGNLFRVFHDFGTAGT